VSKWSHAKLDSHHIDLWAGQFLQLGAPPKLPELILASLRFVSPADLGDLLGRAAPSGAHAPCVNYDDRTHGKSAEVIANLLTKHFSNRHIFKAPADAVAAGNIELCIYEDGLFTGTEAVGILESLLGERDPSRSKTKALDDRNAFSTLQIAMVYGLGTDYGVGIIQKSLKERGFVNVQVSCAESLRITPAELHAQLQIEELTVTELWETGPPEPGLNPAFLEFAKGLGSFTDSQLVQIEDFCKVVGRQLFLNYTHEMKRRSSTYREWPAEKLDKCSWGMWGQGLTVAFGHSVPKASLPLLWGVGAVAYNGKVVSNWRPLFPNAF